MKLFLATTNAGKARELQRLLANSGLEVEAHTSCFLGGMPEVEEDQKTFEGNALKKARALAALLPEDGLALADDSGLAVDALDGAPGVRSARYAGPNASAADNVAKLLDALNDTHPERRGAAFVCCLAAVAPHAEEKLFRGSCRGAIALEPAGDSGFGYDPVFVPEGEERSFAQMSQEEKGRFSHRGAAMRELIRWLAQTTAL